MRRVVASGEVIWAGKQTGRVSCYMMAARFTLPVLKVLFLFFTGRGSSFLSQKEKEKNGGVNRTDRVVFGAAGNHKAVLFGGTGP